MWQIAAALGAAVGGVALVVLLRSGRAPRPIPAGPEPAVAVAPERGAARLAEALGFPTVSHRDPRRIDEGAFRGLQAWMERAFPRVHEVLEREAFGLTLLYTWPGRDPALLPVLLMAHQDVVPAAVEDGWTHPPFEGRVVGGFVWGRGALDMKGSLVGILQAAEALLEGGFAPRRTIVFAFGHDEEVGGAGNRAAADALRRRGTRLHWVLDEGLAVTEGVIPGLPVPGALIGVAEKGYLSVELVAEAEGGHSSIPPSRTAVGALARALARIEENPLPARLDPPIRAMLEALAPFLPLPLRLASANLWLFGPLVRARLERRPATAAALRTTAAPTVVQGGERDNVLPDRARAVLNLRVHPRDTTEGVLEQLRRTAAPLGVTVQPLPGAPRSEPSSLSPMDGPGYRAVAEAIRAVFPGTAVAPGLVLGGTDSRHYADLAGGVYRFAPFRVGPDDLKRIHGVDERVSVANVAEAVRFYASLLQGAAR
ncbi:MAG: M20 family peptidase [Deferrisomatales bacterium]